MRQSCLVLGFLVDCDELRELILWKKTIYELRRFTMRDLQTVKRKRRRRRGETGEMYCLYIDHNTPELAQLVLHRKEQPNHPLDTTVCIQVRSRSQESSNNSDF